MKIQIARFASKKLISDLAIVFLSRKQTGKGDINSLPHWPANLAPLLKKSIKQLPRVDDKPATGLVQFPENDITRLLIVFYDDIKPDINQAFREAGGEIADQVTSLTGRSGHILIDRSGSDLGSVMAAIVEGFLLGQYKYDEFKSSRSKLAKSNVSKLIFMASAKDNIPRMATEVKDAIKRTDAVNFTRTLGNKPANHLTPTILARIIQNHFRSSKRITVSVLDQDGIKKLKMGAFLAVAQGSVEAPKLITIRYRSGKKNTPRLMLVGKGVTFDSGGISIKPSANMEEMKFDMAGAATVVGVMAAVEDLRPEIDIVAIIPASENLPDAHAVKPGDVVTACNGKTIEIINTDAEGRLLLADSLAYGVIKYKPDWVVDLATLTGSVVVALGTRAAGLYCNDEQLTLSLTAAGEETGERVWPMPLWDSYRKDLDSEVADLKNVGGRDAGSITAAKFLQEFVGDARWAHLDIAGTAYGLKDISYLKKGASGFGVRLILALIDKLIAQADISRINKSTA